MHSRHAQFGNGGAKMMGRNRARPATCTPGLLSRKPQSTSTSALARGNKASAQPQKNPSGIIIQTTPLRPGSMLVQRCPVQGCPTFTFTSRACIHIFNLRKRSLRSASQTNPHRSFTSPPPPPPYPHAFDLTLAPLYAASISGQGRKPPVASSR